MNVILFLINFGIAIYAGTVTWISSAAALKRRGWHKFLCHFVGVFLAINIMPLVLGLLVSFPYSAFLIWPVFVFTLLLRSSDGELAKPQEKLIIDSKKESIATPSIDLCSEDYLNSIEQSNPEILGRRSVYQETVKEEVQLVEIAQPITTSILSKQEVALNRKRSEKDNAKMLAQREKWEKENKRSHTRNAIVVELPLPVKTKPVAKKKPPKKKRLDDIEFSYIDSKNDYSERRLIVHSIDDVYLKGFDLDRRAVRMFKVDSIQGLIVSRDSGEMFTPDQFIDHIEIMEISNE